MIEDYTKNKISCLRKIRFKLGMSQAEFAKFLGVSIVSISRWESFQRKPNYAASQKIVERLKERDIHLTFEQIYDYDKYE